ncbi:uncharacterized protein LOC142589024 [Dermacentor variabilis]|uniref:uncharacterized protein LOC142589024 n=1 Tax=Dermacentor variabilis TaxID=34621 RepID=UPI003F5CA097
MILLMKIAIFEILFFSTVCAMNHFEDDFIGFPFERTNREQHLSDYSRSHINNDYFGLPRPNRHHSTSWPRPVFPSSKFEEQKCGRMTCPRGTRCASFNVYCLGGNCPPVYYCQPTSPEPINPYLNSGFFS